MIKLILKPDSKATNRTKNFAFVNKDYTFLDSETAFGNLSKINIFIGENNSGKSRFLRYLFKTPFYGMSLENFKSLYALIKRTQYSRISILNAYREVKYDLKDFDELVNKIGQNSPFVDSLETFCEFVFDKIAFNVRVEDKYYFPVLRGIKDYKGIIYDKLIDFSGSTRSIQNKDSIHHFISLLDLEPSGLNDFDIYREIIVREYFADSKGLSDNILTGGKFYNEIKSMLLGDESQRKVIEDFQKFLHENFFFDYDNVQLIPNEAHKVLFVKIGTVERAIYNWGDGIQQLIVILFFLFKYKDSQNKIFFIEEPEMYLHPGILRKFIEVINSDVFKNHQYFITTHSNNILDMSADNISMSIFKFKKPNTHGSAVDNFTIEQCNYGDISLLNELGVRNSSVFLSNCSIWVEGITDRLYLKHYIELYIKKFDKTKYRENIDYTFIEYGGGNLAHFNFDNKISYSDINAKYINNKIFLIADNDGTKVNSAKGKRKEHLRVVLKENFYELKAREIENLITCDVLKSVLTEKNQEKTDAINRNLTGKKNIYSCKIGKFLDEVLETPGKYSSESGTVKDKVNFCKDVISKIYDFDMLSDEAKQLTKKIYDFIDVNSK